MNNDYKKIPGNAVYSKDGILLEMFLEDIPKVSKIVELGTFYGRHTVLWSSIVQSKGIECDYITIDEENYLGSWDARIIAEKNIRLHCQQVEQKFIQSFDSAPNKIKEICKDESVDIIAIDMEYNLSKLSRMLSNWHKCLSVGGYLKWYIPYPDIKNESVYKNTIQELEELGYKVEYSNDIGYAKKTKSASIHDAKPKNKTSTDVITEQTIQEKK